MTDQTPIHPPSKTLQPSLLRLDPSLKPSPLDYRPMIKGEIASGDLTQEQADAFLRSLFTIMERFVLDGNDFVPVDKLLSGFESAASNGASVINLEPSNNDKMLSDRTERGCR